MEKLSKYRMGWLLVLFDLPTNTKDEQRKATRFRNDLLDLGYLMLQYSVYAKCAISLEKKEAFINEVRRIVPDTGNIQCFFITDSQWGKCITLSKPAKQSRRQFKNQKTPEQLVFW